MSTSNGSMVGIEAEKQHKLGINWKGEFLIYKCSFIQNGTYNQMGDVIMLCPWYLLPIS